MDKERKESNYRWIATALIVGIVILALFIFGIIIIIRGCIGCSDYSNIVSIGGGIVSVIVALLMVRLEQWVVNKIHLGKEENGCD